VDVVVLDRETWLSRRRAHEERLAPYVEPHLERRRAGIRHPVHDFLFGYYSQRPARLLRWHPGFGVGLTGPGSVDHTELAGYVERDGVVTVERSYVSARAGLVSGIQELLVATAARPGSFGCFGLHEWAMVHRLSEQQTRHPSWPLRLGAEGTDRVVESHRIACSHFDAFRFFTPSARPLNILEPGRDDRVAFEQPGCLHANMDLYKHAFRLSPMVSSDLVADCFELAWEIRDLDMRASPYDLRDLGYEPVRIETADGRQEYAVEQRAFAERAQVLRERLIDACDGLLGD
jgi:hypothetical protein